MVEAAPYGEILDFASQNDNDYLAVATAIAQRMVNLRQELADQNIPLPDGTSVNPDQDDIAMLERCFDKRPSPLPYEVWRKVELTPYFKDPNEKGFWLVAHCLGEDPDLFFPERGAPVIYAKKICDGCVVEYTCLEWALRHGEKFGIYGGQSERERRRLRRARALARKSLPEAPSD